MPEVYQDRLFAVDKRCSRCTQVKPTSDFYRNRSSKDGLNSLCKACVRQKNKDKYWANPGREKAAAKRWTEANPEKAKARAKAYRQENREALRQKDKAYYEANRERILAQMKEHRELHKEEISRRNRAYREANPEKIREMKREEQRRADPERLRSRVRNRRARLRAAEGNHTADDIQTIREEQDGKCYWCDVELAKEVHVDHLIPTSRGGSNWPENIALTCRRCNQRKADKTPDEFRQWLADAPELTKRGN